MTKFTRYYIDKATVCKNKNCITVYGETAKIVNAIAVCAALIVAITYVNKALR